MLLEKIKYLFKISQFFLYVIFVGATGYAQENTNAITTNPNSVTRENDCEKEKLLAYNPIVGAVPLAYGHRPATDLVCDSYECGSGIRKGDVLNPASAHKYYLKRHKETRCQWSLADLNPVIDHESSYIYSGKDEYARFKTESLTLGLNDLDRVDLVSDGWARLGNYRVTVSKENQYGVPKQYSLFLSKTVHNFLLRSALLRKLGYKIPPTEYVKRLKIRFSSKKKKELFIKNISINNAGSFDRWILSEKDLEIVVQDIVVMEDQEFTYNLSKGYLTDDIFQGKRIYDSLLIPFALVNTPESINLFEWTVGRRYSDNILLKFSHARQYDCSRDDAVWMARKILNLHASDWQDIVDETRLPPSVKLLLLEKLKSRRNHLGILFDIQNINLPVNALISNHNDLKDGEIIKEFYDGYARRFMIPDPESPLSSSEMFAFFKSKSITTGLELLMNTINSSKFLGSDISGKVKTFTDELAQKVAQTAIDGEPQKLPFKTYIFPTVRGNLILNRDIVAGSYLGTDNMIQLVDTVGASINAGLFGGATGAYLKVGKFVRAQDGVTRQFVPVDLTANSNVFFNRTYSHVRPITSVQKALKYPFKNIFVPHLKRKYGRIFDSFVTDFYQNMSDNLKKDQNKKTYNQLKSKIFLVKDFVEDLKKSRPKRKILRGKKTKNYDALYSRNHSSELINKLDELEKKLTDTRSIYLKSLSLSSGRELRAFSSEVNKTLLVIKDSVKEFVLTQNICLVTEIDLSSNEEESNTEKKKCLDESFNSRLIGESMLQEMFPKLSKVLGTVTSILEVHNYHLLKLEGQEEKREIEKSMEMFNKELEIGESIIITDTVGASLTAGVGAPLYQVVKVRLNTSASKVVVNRLHILRASEKEIHVYKDLGSINSLGLSTSVEQLIPLMKFTFRGSKGRGKTKFYKIPIGDTLKNNTKNLKRVDYLKALRSTLMTGSTQLLKRIKSPWSITHKFKERDKKFGALVWRWNWLKQSDYMQVTSPDGHSKKLYRRVTGSTKGIDFENYARDLVDVIAGKILNAPASIRSFNQGNPGFTYMGRAKNKISSYEGVVSSETGLLEKPYIKITRIWNGWKLPKKKALKILKKIKQRYRFDYLEEDVLAQTQKLFLYNINVNFFIYDKGIEFMLNLPKKRVEYIFEHYQRKYGPTQSTQESRSSSKVSTFFRYIKKYKEAKKEKDLSKMSKWILKATQIVEDRLRLSGMGLMFGGGNNLFSIARIDGFRIGDPNGDQRILSNSFGRVGREELEGPLAKIKRFIGITEGEFTLSWLLGRVI